MQMCDKDYIPTEEDLSLVKQWVDKFEESCLPVEKQEEVKDWDKFREAEEKYLIFEMFGVYQSRYFPFYLKTDNLIHMPNLKYFKTEREFQRFIKQGRYLVYKCIKGADISGSGERFAVYYHYDFGKIGWFKNKLQFFINKFDLPKELIIWYYSIKNIPRPKLDIKLRFDG